MFEVNQEGVGREISGWTLGKRPQVLTSFTKFHLTLELRILGYFLQSPLHFFQLYSLSPRVEGFDGRMVSLRTKEGDFELLTMGTFVYMGLRAPSLLEGQP